MSTLLHERHQELPIRTEQNETYADLAAIATTAVAQYLTEAGSLPLGVAWPVN